MAALQVESAGLDRRRLERSVVTLELFGRAGKVVGGDDLSSSSSWMRRWLASSIAGSSVRVGEVGFGVAFGAADQLEPRWIEGLGRLGRQESGQPLRGTDILRRATPAALRDPCRQYPTSRTTTHRPHRRPVLHHPCRPSAGFLSPAQPRSRAQLVSHSSADSSRAGLPPAPSVQERSRARPGGKLALRRRRRVAVPRSFGPRHRCRHLPRRGASRELHTCRGLTDLDRHGSGSVHAVPPAAISAASPSTSSQLLRGCIAAPTLLGVEQLLAQRRLRTRQ